MRQLPAKGNESDLASAIHLEFIQTVAESKDGDGQAEVEAYHRAIFLHHYGKDLERFQQQRHTHQDRLAHLEARLQFLYDKLAGREKLVPVNVDGAPDTQPSSPWNFWDRTMFAAALAGILCLLVFGIFNISFNLLESGLVTFVDHPIRAYFWTALLPVGALGVKIGWDFLQSQRKRDAYLWTCLALGIAGVLVWVAAYASVYPALSKTTEEQIASLSVTEASSSTAAADWTIGGAKWIDMTIVASQAVAEIFLSAVLGMYMTALYIKHRPVRLAESPGYVQIDEERRALEETVALERNALAEAKGSESRLQHQLEVFVSYAKSLFQKEAALRRDRTHQQRLLLSQIAEQLKTQLEAVENGNGGPKEKETRSLDWNRKRPYETNAPA